MSQDGTGEPFGDWPRVSGSHEMCEQLDAKRHQRSSGAAKPSGRGDTVFPHA